MDRTIIELFAKLLILIVISVNAACANESSNETMTEIEPGVSNEFFRIVGGRLAGPNEFPYQVALYFQSGLTFKFRCGGSIYNNRFIITASHCLQDLESRRTYYPEIIRVAVGGLLEIPRSTEYSSRFAQSLLRVRTVHVHPQFSGELNPLRGSPTNDIGLLEMEDLILYSNSVRKINIARRNEVSTGPADMSGYGLTTITTPFQVPTSNTETYYLKTARQNVYPRAVCGIRYVSFLPDYWLCVGTLTMWQGSCGGDSGGPLICQRRGTTERYLCGVVSTGQGCGLILTPELFTDVGKFTDYIVGIAGPQ
jgi:secreted trypsin-like serine protease